MRSVNKKLNYKFLHISRQGSKNGGAAAFRTHDALSKAGYHSRILLKSSYDDYGKDIEKMISTTQLYLTRAKNKIASYLPHKPPAPALQSDPNYYYFGVNEEREYFNTNELLKKVHFTPDIIVFYFIDEFLNYKNVYEIQQATGAKVFLYPMDMGPLTGGCHYTWDCGGYKNLCGSCPAVLEVNEKGRANSNLAIKKKYIDATDLTVLAASQWLLENINESYLFKDKEAYKLLLPVDSDTFRPHPKEQARKYFNIQSNKKTIFFGAQYLKDKRKGLTELLKVFQILSKLIIGTELENNIQLLIAGRQDEVFLSNLPFEYKFIGLIDNNTELPLAYSAADVFACPSVQDAGPMMINESLMCGTPVVSFNMGVAGDIVISEVTGYRAALYDCFDFAQGIFRILLKSQEEYMGLSKESRSLAMKQYSTNSLVSRFESIFLKNFESRVRV